MQQIPHTFILASGVNHRLDCVRKLRWEAGPVIPSFHQDKLSIREKEYFSKYNDIITDYIEELGLDVTTYVEVSYVMILLTTGLTVSSAATKRFAD